MDAIYVSANSFKVIGDHTSEFVTGRRVKMDCGLDGLFYAAIVSSSYSAPYTTVQIDESDLTASLTDVWYSVISPGTAGGLPNHTHTGIEGDGGPLSTTYVDNLVAVTSGTLQSQIDALDYYTTAQVDTISGSLQAQINNLDTIYATDADLITLSGSLQSQIPTDYYTTAQVDTISGSLQAQIDSITFYGSLVDLSDTPSVYSEGKYLRSTASGTEWATVSGSSGGISNIVEDTTPELGGDLYTGAYTISGTGDIYCNDIYTASGTVYIGPLKLSTDGTNLLVNDAAIEATGSITTFSGLSDTPTDYGIAGQILASTGSGIEWSNINSVNTDIVADTLVKEWDLTSSDIDELFDWDGENEDVVIEFSIDKDNTVGSIFTLLPNNDTTSANYVLSQTGVSTTPTTTIAFQDPSSITGLYVGGTGNTADIQFHGSFRASLKKATLVPRVAYTEYYRSDSSRWLAYQTYWKNTADVVTSIKLSLTGINNGWVRLYKRAKISLPVSTAVGSTTFSGLSDTPSTYIDGNYLRMTASGITTVSGIILEAPNGSEWLLQVTNSGTLYTTEVI